MVKSKSSFFKRDKSQLFFFTSHLVELIAHENMPQYFYVLYVAAVCYYDQAYYNVPQTRSCYDKNHKHKNHKINNNNPIKLYLI